MSLKNFVNGNELWSPIKKVDKHLIEYDAIHFMLVDGEYESWRILQIFDSVQSVKMVNNRTDQIKDFTFLELCTENKMKFSTSTMYSEYAIIEDYYSEHFGKIFVVLETDESHVVLVGSDNIPFKVPKKYVFGLVDDQAESWVNLYGMHYVYAALHEYNENGQQKVLTYIGRGALDRIKHLTNGRSSNKMLRKFHKICQPRYLIQNVSMVRSASLESLLIADLRPAFNTIGNVAGSWKSSRMEEFLNNSLLGF